jgi:hypothetical protein
MPRQTYPQLLAENKRLKSTLSSYADQDNWEKPDEWPRAKDCEWQLGNGYDLAKSALQEDK